MRDLTQPDTPEEFMTLDIDRVSKDQRDRIQVGAIFYCSITRSKQRYSKTRMNIHFPQDQVWTKEDLRKATEAAKKYEGWIRPSKS